VSRRVHVPLAGALGLLAELLDDVRPRRRPVAQYSATGSMHERIDHVVRKAVRVEGEWLRGDDAHQLPVARCRVLALRPLDEPACDRGSPGLWRATLERRALSVPGRCEVLPV